MGSSLFQIVVLCAFLRNPLKLWHQDPIFENYADINMKITVLLNGQYHFKDFLDYLNLIYPTMKFTMEISVEPSSQLPFVEILLKQLPKGRKFISACMKRTHTNQYLNTML